MERGLSMIRLAASGEVLFVFAGVVAYIWRLQFTFPDFAVVLLVFIISTFFLHRDRLPDLGFGSRGLLAGTKAVAMPSLMIGGVLAVAAVLRGAPPLALITTDKLVSVGKYFAWCLLQEFVLQSFFANRLILIFKDQRRAAWMNGLIFAAVHIPNPVLVPVTFLGGYLLTRIFFSTRNIVPLALAQAIVGSLLAVAVPSSWHHGLRVGPGYYR
jgi:CAAX prenyl protease-like protein